MEKNGKMNVGIQVRPSLWRKFKLYCSTKNLKMSGLIEEIIEKFLKENK